MAVRLRLSRGGAKKRPFYRIVAADKRRARDGRFIELLGTYDPLQEPPIIRMNVDRVDYWIGVGALPSETVQGLVTKVKAGDGIDLSEEGADAAARQAKAEARKQAIENARKEAAAKAAAEAKAAEEAKKAEEEAKKAEEEAKAAEEAAEAAEEESADEEGAEETAEEADAEDSEDAAGEEE